MQTSMALVGGNAVEVGKPVEPTADDAELFWTQADNGKAVLNLKHLGKWHRFAIDKGSAFFIYLSGQGTPQLMNERANKLDKKAYDIVYEDRAPLVIK